MTIKIDRKIIKYQVQKPEDKPPDKAPDKASEAQAAAAKAASEASIAAEARAYQSGEPELVRDKNGKTAKVIRMHEKLERPEVLIGSTYKIKTPVSDHAMYVTINDIVLNEGTEYEQRRPFEVFINSKNLDHFQWIVALTRIISAVFRKGGDVTFLVDELKAVFDPRGGYLQPGGEIMPSIIAELGYVNQKHLQSTRPHEAAGRLPRFFCAPDHGNTARTGKKNPAFAGSVACLCVEESLFVIIIRSKAQYPTSHPGCIPYLRFLVR